MEHLEDPHDRYRTQFRRIQQVFTTEAGVDLNADLTAPSYAYDRNHLIVSGDEDFEYVRDNHGGQPAGGERYGSRLVRVEEDALEVLQRVRGERAQASIGLNHLLTVCADDVNLCPADEPIPVDADRELIPGRSQSHSGFGVTVDVIDTGLVPDLAQFSWLADLTPLGPYPAQSGQYPLAQGEAVPLDYGHGTFVTGVLRCVAPQTTVRMHNAFWQAGAATEITLRDALADILDSGDRLPDIVSISAGGTSEAITHMQGLTRVVEALLDRGVVLVAAAGNNGNTEPFFPAAIPGVIGVGALREDARGRACFSNYGRWVRIFAPGERLVNAFTAREYVVQHNGRETCRFRRRRDPAWYASCTCVTTLDQFRRVEFHGRARWSGTSFATPIVAGLIAARQSLAGGTARDAADWLLQHPAGQIDGTPFVLPGQSLS